MAAPQSAVAQSADAQRAAAAVDNRLGFGLYRALGQGSDNLVLSPSSVGAALTMALAGARGDTETEMKRALAAQSSTAELADGHRGLAGALSRQSGDGGPAVQIANALHMTRSGRLVSQAFKTTLAEQHGAEIFEGSDLDAVNGWVNQNTHGRIPKILDRLDPNSVCVILNAIYFKGAWTAQFDKRATRPADFLLASGQTVQVPTMHQIASFQIAQADGYDAIRLPYRKSGLGMIVIAPTRGSLREFEARLNATMLTDVIGKLGQSQAGRVDLSLPKFRIEFGADLVSPLQGIGMKLAFDANRADFSGITQSENPRDRLSITQVQHRAFIDANEEGTEAAAATAVGFSVASAPVRVTTLKFDRPFLFAIADEASGAILFMGRVTDPRQTAAK